jgi:hypothetical protein
VIAAFGLQVFLNQEAAPVEALCAYIFDTRTSRLLGQWSTCTARGNMLTIQLAGMYKVLTCVFELPLLMYCVFSCSGSGPSALLAAACSQYSWQVCINSCVEISFVAVLNLIDCFSCWGSGQPAPLAATCSPFSWQVCTKFLHVFLNGLCLFIVSSAAGAVVNLHRSRQHAHHSACRYARMTSVCLVYGLLCIYFIY